MKSKIFSLILILTLIINFIPKIEVMAGQTLEEWEVARTSDAGLIPMGNDGFYGYVNVKNEVIIPYQFDMAYDFSEGLALVCKDDKYGYINTKGEIVIPYQFDDAKKFSEGLAPVNIGATLQLSDQPKGGIYYLEGGLWGFINTDGEIVIPCQFELAYPFSEDLAVIYENGKYGYIDKNGDVAIPIEFSPLAYDFKNGYAMATKDDVYGYINKNGETIVPFEYDGYMVSSSDFSEGLAVVRKDGKNGYVNTKGEVVIPIQYDNARNFSEGLAAVEVSYNNWGYINTSGEMVIEPQFLKADDFSEGFASVANDEHLEGYINKKGELVIPYQFNWTTPFKDGYAGVFIDHKNKVVNANGQIFLYTDNLKPITILVNGENVESDVPPLLVDGTTYVPIRAISEALGATVNYDTETKVATIALDEKTVTITPNGKDVFIVKNDRILVPVRFVSESFGKKVSWDQSTKTVTIVD